MAYPKLSLPDAHLELYELYVTYHPRAAGRSFVDQNEVAVKIWGPMTD